MGGHLFREAIIEYTTQGNAVKVTAMDPESLTEVSIVGSVHASEDELKAVVLQKLDYVLKKKRGEASGSADGNLV